MNVSTTVKQTTWGKNDSPNANVVTQTLWRKRCDAILNDFFQLSSFDISGGPTRNGILSFFAENIGPEIFGEIFDLKNEALVKSDKISEEFRNEVIF